MSSSRTLVRSTVPESALVGWQTSNSRVLFKEDPYTLRNRKISGKTFYQLLDETRIAVETTSCVYIVKGVPSFIKNILQSKVLPGDPMKPPTTEAYERWHIPMKVRNLG